MGHVRLSAINIYRENAIKKKLRKFSKVFFT